MEKNKMNEFAGIVNLSRLLISSIAETKEQEVKHLTNPRCKKPNFANVHYALERLAVREGLEAPTVEEAEIVCRNAW